MALAYQKEKPYSNYSYPGLQKQYTPEFVQDSFTMKQQAGVESVPGRYKNNVEVSNNQIERLVELATPVYPLHQQIPPAPIFNPPYEKYVSYST